MQFLTDWIVVVIVGSLAVMSPGANFFITLRNSLKYSRRAGIYTALGLALGDLVHVSYCLIGIGVLIARSIVLFNVLKWVGAAYLVYIGVQSLRSKAQVDSTVSNSKISHFDALSAIRIGFLTSLLNPKVSLFFLALFTQVIRPNTGLITQAIYGITVAGIEFLWFATVAVLVSHAALRSRFLSISHWVDRVMGSILIGLGLRLAMTEHR